MSTLLIRRQIEENLARAWVLTFCFSAVLVMKVKVVKKDEANENSSVAIESDAGVINFPARNLASDASKCIG